MYRVKKSSMFQRSIQATERVVKQRYLKTSTKNSLQSHITNNFSNDFPSYSHLLTNFADNDSQDRRVYNRPFNEITSDQIRVKEPATHSLTWTSQYDSVARQPFAKDITHLQSLLDALLTSRNFDRAGQILKAIYPLNVSFSDFMYSLNKYLELWARESEVTIKDLETYLTTVIKNRPIKPDSRTYAILINKALDLSQYHDYNQYIDEIKKSYKSTREILNHVDILGIDNLIKVFENPKITENHVPQDFLQLYRQVSGHSSTGNNDQVEEYFKPKSTIPSINKEAETLRSVDSFGLKVVRNTLLGLKTTVSSPALDKLIKNLDHESKTVIYNETSEKRDYFEIYKSLQSDEDRQKFNEALDLFNRTRQRNIEVRGTDSAREKWKHDYEEMLKRGKLKFQKSLNVRLYEWYEALLPYVTEEVNQCRKVLNGEITIKNCDPKDKSLFKERSFYAPYLTLVSPDKMCALTILEILKLNSTGGVIDGMRTARALISVGKAIELEYKSQKLLTLESKSFAKKARTAREWQKIFRFIKSRESKDNDNAKFNDWDSTLQAKVGSVLTSLLIHVAKVPVEGIDPSTGGRVTGSQPAFFHTYQYVQGQKLGILKVHKNIIKDLSKNLDSNLIQPHFLPMVTPPRPWTSYNEGGYLFSQNLLVRSKDSPETVAYLKAASERGDLQKVFDGLNVLGNTAWTVNRRLLEIMTEFWNTGKEFIDIPPIADDPVLPPSPPPNADPNDMKQYKMKVRAILTENANFKSQRCDTNYKLEIARAFIGEKMFFPHNIDFRGRAYPISPHFNHLGNDLTRALFLFWDGKELGELGLRWLKIHLANLYGIDKVPMEDRVKFTEENMENIRKSVENPYDTNGWWTKGEKPWQVLGVCMELVEAYNCPDPTKFISHIPVHQDGSCNGLQHYAALGGDSEGAYQVNLSPADKPQDVYSFVASLVIKRLEKDAETGNKHAIFLRDKITRKVVKQTVMTNVYGVTFVGARDQIKKQIKHFFTADENPTEYAQYLTHHVFGALRELFENAHNIQDWLGEAARIISKSVRIDYEETTAANANKPNHLSSVIWTTSLGLPCVQPYRSSKRQIISTNLQEIAITDPFVASPVDARKQKTALPPNFVHSLDATHMLMTASSCKDYGLTFASVHDSYWTHACDLDVLNRLLRQQFVNLHENDLILKVKEEFEARYKGFLQVMIIPRDHELVKKIQSVRKKIASDIGRALTVADEIRLEKIRQQNLNSPNPLEVEYGKKLVTTISVFEGYDVTKIPQQYGGYQVLAPVQFPPLPKKGDFNVESVKESTYFFS